MEQVEHRALEASVRAVRQDRHLGSEDQRQLVLDQAAASQYYPHSPVQTRPQPVQSA